MRLRLFADSLTVFSLSLCALLAGGCQPPTSPQQSNPPGSTSASPELLRQMAADYYQWRNESYPVASSNNGLHTWDHQLTDYSERALKTRRDRIKQILAAIRAMDTSKWGREDRIDWLLFGAQLEEPAFFDRVMQSDETDPQVYVAECSNGIFSLLKKEYDSRHTRALAATARLKQMPALIEQAKRNLTRPVRLYAKLAVDSARSIDSLFNDSLMVLANELTEKEKTTFVEARDEALRALHAFADWLEQKLTSMVEWSPMGEENYSYMLRHIYLLPLDARQVAMLGEVELARFRALESFLSDPKLANPDPSRSKSIPADQQAFLKAYESRQAEIIRFLMVNRLVTIPSYLGPFYIRQLPEAFKPTSPGGFMNAPGLYDRDASGFYFIPAYDPKSRNFYIRAAIEDARPILAHEGIPGHFMQISIANHLPNEIRRQHGDGVFIEGWALYTEEMLMHTGFYSENSPAAGQVLRLSRYRAARVGVDVNLHTGKWTFEQAIQYFQEAGGLDREAAEGEAAGAASAPSQKITYMVGKWEIMRLLGRYRDRQGEKFQLGQFHDELLKNGSLPIGIIEWLMLDDATTLEQAIK